METPESIKADEPNYQPDAWREYSINELGMWVHLLCKRAVMRSLSAKDKAAKDLNDAQAYLDMMQSQLRTCAQLCGVLEKD